MSHDLITDDAHGHITVTIGGNPVARIIDLGDYAQVRGIEHMDAREAWAIGAALQKWSINKRRAGKP